MRQPRSFTEKCSRCVVPVSFSALSALFFCEKSPCHFGVRIEYSRVLLETCLDDMFAEFLLVQVPFPLGLRSWHTWWGTRAW